MRTLDELKSEVLELRRNAFIETIMGLNNETYIVGYIGKIVPKEIFYGFNLIPLPLDGIDLHILKYSQEKGICNIINSTLTYAITNKCPLIYNAKLIVTDNSCPMFSKILKENLNEKIFVYENLEDLKKKIKSVYNRTFDEKSFLNSVELSKKISAKLYALSKTNIDSKFLYEVEFYTEFIFSLEKRLNLIDEILSKYKDVNNKRKIIYVPRAIQILDEIDKNFKNYKIVEGCFCLGENFLEYKKFGYEFLKEKYGSKKEYTDILFKDCPYDKNKIFKI
ncbi:MAG: 2-hydroxyacyl-CoA dehydratase family protein [Peptoniphilaceae bacterium]|uniref:2-hydroxyacyl-CoA dehydratase family protein n=1 Tax=Parvimonas sp. TaxID=1944660 RepID=UPI0025D04C58|nr:2-hydroxyacyl-CoA dehydratase family protein [Parvimonas sp.]MCI5997884.1 2-hydroxyacyl-CoA dehydratase family protein [Parvimonas sp.]MDD7765122.1 2-hydroxyacyl-CoA dehydratase family protein [Peptoniphilaceae bacterium]MDY3051492.1 2-hydroxyacyl-CoA dehydratase family protein [Parvimonas sp.]